MVVIRNTIQRWAMGASKRCKNFVQKHEILDQAYDQQQHKYNTPLSHHAAIEAAAKARRRQQQHAKHGYGIGGIISVAVAFANML